MIEIKVTGNTSEEIKESMFELNKVLNVNLAAEEMTAGLQEEPKKEEPKKEEPKKEEPVKEEPKKEEPVKEEPKKEEPKKEEPKKEEPKKEEPKKEEKASFTIVDVRAKAMELQRAGKKDLVKGVIEATGASKLSEMPEDKYSYAMECFEAGEVL